MESKIEHGRYDELAALNDKELSAIYGGDFWYDISVLTAYASHVFISLIQDNIEHPIGAAGGYPPK